MSNTDQSAKAPAVARLESLTALAIVGILALALGLAGLVLPATKAVGRSVHYTQSGAFHYSAAAKESSVYGMSGLRTGEPIISKLVGPVRTRFTYQLKAATSVSAGGTTAMDVTVKLPQGFQRTFVVAAKETFTGATASVSGALPIHDIKTYVRSAEQSIGMGTAGSFGGVTVTLRPHVKIQGTVAGRALATSYSPELSFSFDGSTLTPSSDEQAGGAAAPVGGSAAASPFHPSKSGSVSYDAAVANTVPLAVVHPTVSTARIVGFGLAGLCLLITLWLARPLFRSRDGAGERDRIAALYGTFLVPTDSIIVPDVPVADVSSIDALADLAKRYEARILHVRGDGDAEMDCYLVWDNGMLFRYRSASRAPARHGRADDDAAVLSQLLSEGEPAGDPAPYPVPTSGQPRNWSN